MKKTIFVVIILAMVCCFALAAGATTSKGLQMANAILNDEPTKSAAPAPSIKSNGECKPTIVSSAISDEKLAQLARELRRENEKKAAILRAEMYGKGGTAKNPKGGVIGGIIDQMKDFKDALQEVDDKVKGEAEARKLLDARVEAQGKRLERVVEVVNVHADMINKNQRKVEKIDDSIKYLWGVIILLFIFMVIVAIKTFKSKSVAPAGGHTP